MRCAPASSAFSTSSLTALAGRSTTSPAAILLIVPSSRRRIRAVVTSTVLRRLALEIFARQHLAFFDGRLIEGIDAHQFAHENRLQHELHEERTQGLFVEQGHRDAPDGPTAAGQALAGCPRLGRYEIA